MRVARAAALACALAGCHGADAERPVEIPSALKPSLDAGSSDASLEGTSDVADAGDATPSWPPPPPTGVVTDWCGEGWTALDEETCYVLPPAPTRRLLVYLHGIVPPTPTSTQKENVQRVVAAAARRAGYAALLPRGRRGIGPGATPDWWAWPTSANAYAKYARVLVEGFFVKRRALEAVVGAPFARTFLAGSSNGAYFLAVLALRGAIDVDGFGAMSGGSAANRSKADLASIRSRPFYVGYGSFDESKTGPIALGELLARAGWVHRIAEHRVSHGAKEVYLDEAFAFWTEAAP